MARHPFVGREVEEILLIPGQVITISLFGEPVELRVLPDETLEIFTIQSVASKISFKRFADWVPIEEA